ncbi:MAG TPA: hypothetical protein VEP49_04140 [Acidimicrobiia bacterium]|nr:hypothetical protein [Acidimicrobiia bacterium]
MADALRTDRVRTVLAAVGLAVLASVIVLVATRHGPGTSPDSVQYVASARNLVAGRGFTGSGGDTLTSWPPGYPGVLAVGLELGLGVNTTARVVNVVAMAAIVLLTFVLLRRHVRSTWLVLIATGLVAVSPTLLRTADMIWSEPLFCALLLAFVLVLESLVSGRRHRVAWFVACVAAVWAAALVRWAGIALIPAGMVAIGVTPPRERWIRRVLVFAVGAGLVPALWFVRNVTTGDSIAGARPTLDRTVSETARTLLLGIGRIVVPDGAPNALTELAAVVLILAFVAGTVLAIRGMRAGVSVSAWPMAPLVATTGFTILLLLGSYFFGGTPWNARILAPVYAPLVVIGFVLFERAREQARAVDRDALARFVAGVFFAWLVLVVAWAAGLAWDHGRHERGYASAMWRSSALVRTAGTFDRHDVLFTNVPLEVSSVTGRYPVLDARSLRARCRKTAVLALYGNASAQPRLDSAVIDVGEVHRVADGALYRLACRA